MANNYCGCSGNGDTPEYIIRLNSQGPTGPQGPQGEQGFSPIVSYTMTKDDIHFTIVNEDNIQDTPNFFNYVAKKDLSNVNFANPFTINGTTLETQNNGMNSHLTMQGTSFISSTAGLYIDGGQSGSAQIRISDKAYYNNNEIATINDIPTVPDVTNKLNTDGSNIATDFIVNNHYFIPNNISLYDGNIYGKNSEYGSINFTQTNPDIYAKLGVNSNGAYINLSKITLSSMPDKAATLNTSEDLIINQTGTSKVFYRGTASNNEVATLEDIPTVNNPTVTLTQGGETKGTFTLNQTNDVTIDLEEGGDVSLKLPLTIDGDPYVVDGETRIPFIKLYKTQTTQGIVSGTKNSSGDELNSASMVITSIGGSGLSTTYPSDNVAIINVDYDNDTIGLNSDNKLAVIKDYALATDINNKLNIDGSNASAIFTVNDVQIQKGQIKLSNYTVPRIELVIPNNTNTFARMEASGTGGGKLFLPAFTLQSHFTSGNYINTPKNTIIDIGKQAKWYYHGSSPENEIATLADISSASVSNPLVISQEQDGTTYTIRLGVDALNATPMLNYSSGSTTTNLLKEYVGGNGISVDYQNQAYGYDNYEIRAKVDNVTIGFDNEGNLKTLGNLNEEIANLTAQYNSLLQRVIALETNINGGNA